MEGKEETILRAESSLNMKDLNSDLGKGFSIKRNSKREEGGHPKAGLKKQQRQADLPRGSFLRMSLAQKQKKRELSGDAKKLQEILRL